MMRGIPAKHGLKRSLFLAFALTAGLGLAACSDVDSLFGGDSGDMTASDAPTAGDAGAPPTAAAPAAMPASSGGAPVATITPVTIDEGPDTGTAVNKTIQSLRAQVAGLQQRLASNSARLIELRNQGAGAAGAYQEAKAHITTRLQVGTTRGNPELVAQWNTAQGQLDALSANVNALNALGTDATNDSSTAHYALEQISATFNAADFFSLYERDKETLGADVLAREEFQLMPGDKRQFQRPTQADTRFVAVVAAFRDLERAQWRAASAVPLNQTTPIVIKLDGSKVSAGAS